MFSFNGGPGSASIWLHMGALGPKRVVMTDKGESLPPPYKWQDNEFSWLDETDLVFIDFQLKEPVSIEAGILSTVAWERSHTQAEFDPHMFNYEAEDAAVAAR